ncbi:MAG: hypothetical protein LUQ49_04800, partial [Methanomicrobiales archaeon]|nr:hypothetical protein [Methanomicrobiales archaeon]
MRHGLVILAILVGGLILGAGCSGTGKGGASWSVPDDGYLAITCPVPAIVNEQVIMKNSSLALSRVSVRNIDEEVYGLLAAPGNPRGAVILAPGAGVTKEAEKS